MTRSPLLPLVILPVVLPGLQASLIVTSASGPDIASIQPAVDLFRASLGSLNPNLPGSAGGGRREINWDGVPNTVAAPNNMPPDFFNTTSPRGVVFSTPGLGFQISANAGVAPVEFDNLNATYSSIFQTFSTQRLFTALGSNVMDVSFFVPGTSTPATVSGFGAIFTDVDLPSITGIQAFDASNNPLGTHFAPTANQGLSFVGVAVSGGDRIGRVRITSGNVALGPNDSNGNPADVVAMDDFIFGEPIAVPEPRPALLSGLGLLVFARVIRRRLKVSVPEA